MMNKLNSLRKSKAGFTLVELIVVLVILAILAALLIPALTGYIEEAKEKQITAETRMCVMAAQTLYGQYYATADAPLDDDKWWADQLATNADFEDDFYALAEIEIAENGKYNVSGVEVDEGKISALIYSDGVYTCTYGGSTYETEKKDGTVAVPATPTP